MRTSPTKTTVPAANHRLPRSGATPGSLSMEGEVYPRFGGGVKFRKWAAWWAVPSLIREGCSYRASAFSGGLFENFKDVALELLGARGVQDGPHRGDGPSVLADDLADVFFRHPKLKYR